MSEKYTNFRSKSDLDAQKEENRRARHIILEQAKRSHERAEAKKEKARKQGEGTWMLDSVSQRISKEEKKLKKAKKKKHKKDKKEKKKKKHGSSSSSSDSDEDREEQWIEAGSKAGSGPGVVVKGPQLQRESWMESPLDLIPTTTRQELRDEANKQKAEAKREAERMLEPGRHARELNPYWKDGGTGLPEEKPEKKSHTSAPSLPSAGAGDRGLSWLRKSYDRCKQQAQEEGRSLEEIAAERWGSLKKLQSMLSEAEEKQRGSRTDRRTEESRNWEDRKRDREREDRGSGGRSRERSRESERDRRREGSRERKGEGRSKRSQDRESSREMSHHRDRSRERQRRREKSDSRERDGRKDTFRTESRSDRTRSFQRPGSDSDDDSRISKSRFMRPAEEDGDSGKRNYNSMDKLSSRFMRPSNDDNTGSGRRNGFMKPSDSDDKYSSGQRSESSSKRFMKPGEGNVESSESRGKRDRRSRSPETSAPRWKRRPAVDSEREHEKERKEKAGRDDSIKERTKERNRKQSRSSSSDSSSSCSDGGSNSSDDEKQETPAAPPPKILSEEELNDLAAKILRAEIMGDDDMVANLKSQLENARKAREAAKAQTGATAPDFSHRRGTEERKKDRRRGRGNDEEEDDNVVVLSRTSKGGLVRPVLGSSDEWGASGGKRRKKNVPTHDTKGERTKYFDDDDKFDLKTLVEQERAGTAEDQNAMFARLAGRSSERDLDVDDMFVSKAAKKQNEEKFAIKDKAAAIFEHKKVNAAMEKCHRCFEKVPKHLIIAIGTKSYLCLPHHRSLSEGHCLIVPMQHVAAATSMDEDVWQEMQHFRKSLVQMFAAQDQDIVFMETVMHLKHFPHTAIECVPLEREVGDLAPIYFKKAIQEAGPEWSDNKKLHSLKDKDVRHVIPKGFPYFSVDFGLEGGFATVIEDEAKFPAYFGREIVGGMLDAEPMLWRKPHKQSFEDQRQKVLQFEQWWRPYDWTQDLAAGD